ncbi:MAG: DUF6036 family nucleotidyltransferase [Actinomycetota bacterium]
MPSSLEKQLQLIVECLDRHGISYVVIGGVAAMLRDIPIKETFDVDIVPDRGQQNLRALAHALQEMEARLRVPNEPEGVPIPLDHRTFKDVSTLTFVTRFGPLDVLLEPSGSRGYKDLLQRAQTVERFGMEIAVASTEDLIAMKRAAGREKDAVHLRILLQFLSDEESRD